MVPEIMHCLFLGIDNQFMKLWKTTRTGCYNYMVNFCKKIDAVLSSISPLDDVPGIVISDYGKHGSDWKANEDKAFMLLISGVAVMGISPSVHYKHWILLVNAGLLLHKHELRILMLKQPRFLFINLSMK